MNTPSVGTLYVDATRFGSTRFGSTWFGSTRLGSSAAGGSPSSSEPCLSLNRVCRFRVLTWFNLPVWIPHSRVRRKTGNRGLTRSSGWTYTYVNPCKCFSLG
ncbi:hypothetical protein HanIR_Chr04g0167971 [Helianthus annuus]|nr:hypothetical protein HanIR_Chr04g0167971 [Helianthus annuus]